MGLMVTLGRELIRYNPSNGHIEYSTSQGRVWSTRYSGSSIGSVKSLIVYRNELILCSDKGVFCSTSQGRVWAVRSSSNRNFIDLLESGPELLAYTDDGHLYYSTSAGRVWSRRK